eukprot:3406882-Pyramimonas_sp.AAC.1
MPQTTKNNDPANGVRARANSDGESFWLYTFPRWSVLGQPPSNIAFKDQAIMRHTSPIASKPWGTTVALESSKIPNV